MELDGFYHPTHPLFELQLALVESDWALRLTERWIWMDENRPLWRRLFGPVLLPPWRQIDRRARIKRERTRAACLIAAAHDEDPTQ